MTEIGETRQRLVPRRPSNTVGESMTQQNFKDECDVNNIMRKFEKTGMVSHVNSVQGTYADYTDMPQSYHEALEQVQSAHDMFMTIPAKIRAEFNNDPGEFLAFVEDPANADKLRDMGLAKAKPEPVPDPPKADPEPPTPPPQE